MKSKTVTTEINISANAFIEAVAKKIKGHERKELDTLVSSPPHLELENVTISNHKLIIEKSIKPLDGFSRYRGISGTIESDILNKDGVTILKTTINLHTAASDFVGYFIGTGIGLIAITWLIVDFNLKVLIGFLIGEGLLYGLPKMRQGVALDGLEHYYYRMIDELIPSGVKYRIVS